MPDTDEGTSTIQAQYKHNTSTIQVQYKLSKKDTGWRKIIQAIQKKIQAKREKDKKRHKLDGRVVPFGGKKKEQAKQKRYRLDKRT